MAYAASTTAREVNWSQGDLISFKMAAVKAAKGTFALMDASAGYVTNIPTASRPFVGVFDETIDNSAGSAGDLSIKVRTKGIFDFAVAAASQTIVGTEVWMSGGSSTGDNITVISDEVPGSVKVGRVAELLSATAVRVRITGYALKQDGSADD
jgi:hypothetical protein